MMRSNTQRLTCIPILFLFTLLSCRSGPYPDAASIERKGRHATATDVLARLTLRQKIGQRFITWIDGVEADNRMKRLVQDVSVGGIILYPWNTADSQQLRELTADLQQLAQEQSPPIGLFMCVDQEGGRVRGVRFKDSSHLTAPFYWSRYGEQYVEAAAYLTSRELVSLGCNMNFAPVLDLYDQPDATIIGDRSFGADPQMVAALGAAYIRGAKRGGIIAVAKHFPGHGSSTIDSHGRLPVVDFNEDELRARDMVPFQKLIDCGLEGIMTAHLLLPAIDPVYPVTLSPAILRGILRDELNYQGLVVSDGIAMGAISENFSIQDTLVHLFRAGVDMILVHSSYDVAELQEYVLALCETNRVTEEEIDEGVLRVLQLKATYGLIEDSE